VTAVVNPGDFTPTKPGWYLRCPDAVVGPFKTEADAAHKRDSIAAGSGACGHAHDIVPVGLQGVTASGTLKP
jgi:hypothetical protein